ncbi:dynamin family protein [uncultured Ruminococcus sp.]|uniref:dynamin family protein n=1 Tax=uncultured Ruminococcus sp. TaxID=165186 RepID=UPI0025EC3C33|nr:dynamin family protein [uncultured Ruminococcus sp.]
MAELLNIVSSYALTNVSPNEVGALIDQMIEKSKDNAEEISELTLECTSLLTSAQNKSNALSSQGIFKRLVGEVTGKNKKLQNAILNDNTNALYAAQTVINKVMLECTNNRTLLVAVNDRVSDLYLELKENQNDVLAQVAMMRKGFVAFYQEFLKENEKQLRKIDKLERYQNSICQKCGYDLISWQRMCPNCGYIHPMKTENSSKETKEILSKLSKVLTDDTSSSDIIWDVTAMKTDAVIRKVKLLAELGKLPAYPQELVKDIATLMDKCREAEFQIAVVGVMKAGKSFLMNALIGAEIASVEVNPETAALTKFRSSNGFYVKIKFHNAEQWSKLKTSALESERSIDASENRDSFAARLKHPKLKEMEAKLIGKEKVVKCKTIEELREHVRKYTSSKSIAHILVSEIEVGIDKSIFNMPPEVVFVDTPGLKDPVPYRSDITKDYIKKANAVLVALKPGPFTAEGIEIATTVLDLTDKSKAIIVGTQSDLNSNKDREKYVLNWEELLVESKRYKDQRDVNSRIVLTSAKMELLLNKWNSLTPEQQLDDSIVDSVFNIDDYNDLESYVKKMLGVTRIDLSNLSPEQIKTVSDSTGISALKRKLETTLIANYRKLMVADIVELYKRCRDQIIEVSNNTIKNGEKKIASSKLSTENLQAEIEKAKRSRADIVAQTRSLKEEAETLIRQVKDDIASVSKKLSK